MSFYRKITRERTICSFRDFSTNDKGLKKSFSSFTKPLRQAVFYRSFQIQNDYYTKTGVNAKNKNDKSADDVYYSDSDKSNSRETHTWSSQDDEKSSAHDRKLIGKSWKKNIPEKCWFDKGSNESTMNGINSSYETNVSSTIYRDKERYEVMSEDLESNFSKTAETERKSCFSERRNESYQDSRCL